MHSVNETDSMNGFARLKSMPISLHRVKDTSRRDVLSTEMFDRSHAVKVDSIKTVSVNEMPSNDSDVNEHDSNSDCGNDKRVISSPLNCSCE